MFSLTCLLGFDDGSPDGLDPLILVRQMAQRGITLVSPNNVGIFYFSLTSSLVLRSMRACIEWLLGKLFVYGSR